MSVNRKLLAAALLPPLATALLIAICGTNVPFWDEWGLAPLLEKLARHQATFADFFQQQSEHRFLFPRLILGPLALETHWNVLAELWLSFAVALAGFAAILLLRRLEDSGRVAITALAYFSLAAYENWLWGWQLSWFLADTAVVVAVAVAGRCTNRSAQIAGAALLCFIATFSVAYGVASWIAVAPLLWLPIRDSESRRSRVAMLAVWAALFSASMTLYLYRFDLAGRARFRGSIVESVAYTAAVIGAPVSGVTLLAAVAGAVLVAWFAIQAARSWNLQDRDQFVWVSVGLFALGFAAINGIGRSGLGLHQALSSRYLTPGSLLLIAAVNLQSSSFRFRRLVFAGLGCALTVQSLTSVPIGIQIKEGREESRVCLDMLLVNDSEDCLPGLVPAGTSLAAEAEAMQRLGILPLVTEAGFTNGPLLRGSVVRVEPLSQTSHPAMKAMGNVELPSKGIFAVVATIHGQRRVIAADLVRGGGVARWSLLIPPAVAERNRSFDLWLFVPGDRQIYPLSAWLSL